VFHCGVGSWLYCEPGWAADFCGESGDFMDELRCGGIHGIGVD